MRKVLLVFDKTIMVKKNFEFLEIPRQMPIKFHSRERIRDFNEVYGQFNAGEASSQSSRCIDCGNPYCEWKCPVHNYIPNWLELVEKGELFKASDLLHSTNSLPEVCGRICPQDRLCEGACTLNDGFGAVTIGSVEKYIADEALIRGWRPDISRVEKTGKRVAIVGAGPAGLSCADVLSRNGIDAHVFDRYPRVGGLLAYGIPSFKLEKNLIDRRQNVLEGMGVKFYCGVEIGTDIPLQKLIDDYDAVFLGMGVYTYRDGGLTGIDNKQVIQALPYLIGNINKTMDWQAFADTPYINLKNKRVLVLGGGDTAMDCVRTAVRQKARRVICTYRREEKDMPGSATEFRNAKEEDVRFLWNLQPIGIQFNEAGDLRGVEMAITHKDADGNLQVTDKRKILNADAVIIAFGFGASPATWFEEYGITTNDHGLVLVDKHKYPFQTNNPKVFSGGDMVRGADLVVTAVYEGRQAAKSITQWLNLPIQLEEPPPTST